MTLMLAVLVAVAPQLPLSMATTDDALAAFANPAGLGTGRGLDIYWLYNFENRPFGDNCAVAARVGPLGGFWEFGSRYGLAVGFGGEGFHSGLRMVRDTVTLWDLGTMWRPARWLSLGATWQDLGRSWGYLSAGAALRPFGSRVTLTADVQTTRLGSADPGFLEPVVGLELEPLDGVAIAARLKPTEMSAAAGVMLGFGQFGIGGTGTKVGDICQAGAVLRAGHEFRRSLLPRRRRFVEVELSGSVADREPGFSLLGSRPSRTTWQLLELFERCREDGAVAGLLLKLERFSAGFGQLTELRRALVDLRAAGKQVLVYAPHLGVGGYYLASAADLVVGHPLGELYVPGLSLQAVLLKGGLDKLGLEVDYQRHGKFKSAVEALAADSVSEPNREQLEAYLDAVFEEFVERASAGRGMSRDSFAGLVDRGFYLAHEAREVGLLDTFCYADELDELLSGEVAGFRKVTEAEYRGRVGYRYEWRGLPFVAVIYACGEIATGESRTDFLTGGMTLGAKTLARAVRAAREDDRVKAIVLRVDSPGGDGFASDLIWRELELVEKPLAVSMGSVAGSGGYYIACNADRVFAGPATLTGSIGVFSMKFVTAGLYEKLGIRRETFKRGERADAMSDARAFTAEEDSVLQAQVDWFYRQFVDKVAEGRGLGFEAVDSVGQGRIWAGSDAYRIGLVDSLGGLLDAVAWAKAEAGLEECDYVFFPEDRGGLGGMFRRMLGTELRKVVGR